MPMSQIEKGGRGKHQPFPAATHHNISAMSRPCRALHLLIVAVPFLGVCHAELPKHGAQGSNHFDARSRGMTDRGKSTRSRNPDGFSTDSTREKRNILDEDFFEADSMSSPFDDLEDMVSSFDERFLNDDDEDDDNLDSGRNDYGDDQDLFQHSSSGDKGALYDAYNQLHTLAQVRLHTQKTMLSSLASILHYRSLLEPTIGLSKAVRRTRGSCCGTSVIRKVGAH